MLQDSANPDRQPKPCCSCTVYDKGEGSGQTRKPMQLILKHSTTQAVVLNRYMSTQEVSGLPYARDNPQQHEKNPEMLLVPSKPNQVNPAAFDCHETTVV
jgi:hypothetical protein